jgi:hypothetical protein
MPAEIRITWRRNSNGRTMPIRRSLFAIAALAALAAAALPVPARADKGAVYVVPSRPGVPIAINGRDASWSVVEGDIGLARPGHLTPVIIGGGRPLPPRWSYHRNAYFPRYGAPPPRGRNEIDPGPDRLMPEPAESYHRSWSTSSDLPASRPREPREADGQQSYQQGYRSGSESVPATIDDGQPPFAPPIVVVPQRGRR